MLKLANITKNYKSGDEVVKALKGINLEFRSNEFVSILDPSGCGKTTLLNIIGGLDRYTSGDLIINGKSTKEFKDKDWDAYRNYSVGFVFQNYNLIPHQSVLSNVELALTLSGVSREERKKRAIEALEKVGLKEHIHKKPNQLSGGQMQRVAIARALVNDPDIILADEPTGALDTKTSVQIMELLKSISKDKLIIMVTHNPELAEKYSTRVIRVLDGVVQDDTNPFDGEKEEKKKTKTGKTAMSFFTAISLSLNNLMTKKGRTILTSFAGSIGIIGIALILSLSTGVQNYINQVQEDTLSSYPIQIQETTVDLTSMMERMMGEMAEGEETHEDGKIYSNNIMTDMLTVLADKLEIEDLDFTEKKLYSLSDETKNKLKDLDEEITIQLINIDDEYIKEYTRKYKVYSDKIDIEEVDDLSSRVDLKTEYNLDDTDSLIVVSAGEKEKTLTLYDLYTIDYSTGQQIDVTEEAVTNAIVEVTIDEKPQIYIFSGKTYYEPEQSLSTITTQLTNEANEVKYLDILSTGSVPDDCDCLIITTLAEDMSEMERDKILEYIQRGGKILFLISQNILEVDTPNLNSILDQYGVSIQYGAIFEQDTTKMLQNAPEFIISDVNASFMSDIGMNLQMCLVDAGSIELADDTKQEELSVEYETIASTGDTAFIRTNFDTTSYTRTDADSEEGSFIVGARATKKISEDVSSEIIIYSNELCASNLQIPVSTQYYMYAVDLYNNKDVILNSISHLTERTDTITIRKTGETEQYTVSEKGDTLIKIIIFTIPAIIILIGLVIWIIRRRRK